MFDPRLQSTRRAEGDASKYEPTTTRSVSQFGCETKTIRIELSLRVNGWDACIPNGSIQADVETLTISRTAEGGDVLGCVDSYGRGLVAQLPVVGGGPREGQVLYELTPPVPEGA